MRLAGPLLAAVMVLSACYRGEGEFIDRSAAQNRYPPGVGLPSGIYENTGARALSCCWMGLVASFRTTVPANVGSLEVVTQVPDVEAFHRRTEWIVARVDGGRPRTFAGLGIGVHRLYLSIPRSTKDRIATVHLRMAYALAPSAALRNGPPGPFSLYLKRVRAQ